jgi:hypothetical protein
MFFAITKEPQSNFVQSFKLDKLYVNVDSGWQKTNVGQCCIIYKGYVDKTPIQLDSILLQVEPKTTGNFCAIVYDGVNISIKTDRYRSFPIWYNKELVTNLTALDTTAWSDSLVEISQELAVTETKFDIIGQFDDVALPGHTSNLLTRQEVVDGIDEILSDKIQEFVLHNTLPVHVFLSGGVDSLLVYSYVQRYTDNYKLIKCHHIDYDEFWLKNSSNLKKLWAYNQIHHWQEPCVLTSGAPGDEFMLRSPTTANLFLLAHGTSIPQELEKCPTCLHAEYFKRHKHQELFEHQQPVVKNLNWELCNIIVNDWQHWHIGHTLTFTPLRDLRIFKLLLRLPLADAIGQILNSDISCELIERNSPGLTKLISDQKNSGNIMKNLVDFYKQH